MEAQSRQDRASPCLWAHNLGQMDILVADRGKSGPNPVGPAVWANYSSSQVGSRAPRIKEQNVLTCRGQQ